MAPTDGPKEGEVLLNQPGEGVEKKDGTLEEYNDVQVKCGIKSCAPKCMQPCADVRAYTANVSVLLLIHISIFTYYVGILRTLEKRFGLSSTEVNLPMAVTDLMSTFLGLLIGYCGHRLHIPRAMAFGNMLTGVGILIYTLPYVLYGTMEAEYNSASGFNVSGSGGRGQPLCGSTSNVTSMSGAALGDGVAAGRCGAEDSTSLEIMTGAKFGAYACLIASAVFVGFGGPLVGTLALPYLDDNAKNEDSAMYVGILTSMYALAPILGFLFAALCTRLPENLIGPTDLTPADPRWIGAWWLGFLVFGIVIFLISIPLAMFPKHLKHYYIDNKKKKKSKSQRVKKQLNVAKELKNFPKELWALVSNLPYLMLLLSKITGLYVVTGIFLQLPRYFEIHFGQPAYLANIISGTSGAIVGAFGNVLGGILMKKFKIGVIGSARMYVYALVIGVISTTISMLLACPQTQVSGQLEPATNRLNVETMCNEGCVCSLKSLRPVCANSTNYVTACHAGCTEYDPVNNTYTNCACRPPEEVVVEGFCSSEKCQMLIPYILVGLIGSLLGSIGRVPATMLMFRVVKKEEKAFAVGLLSMGINLLCFVPAPILFGQLFDSACILWQDTCGRRGSCMLYDIAKFRYFMHGVTLVFQVVSLICGIVVLILVTKKYKNGDPEEADANRNVHKKNEESRLN